MAKLGWLLVFVCLVLGQVTAQTVKNIKVNVRKIPLNQVLLDLKENYGLQFAFDNDILSQYNITVNRTFQSDNEALSYLVKNLPLEVEKSGDVFLIIPVSAKQPEPAVTKISGQVLEARTYEPLPFSYILINRKPVQSDQQGHFNFIASADTSYNLQISHLGYFIYDTIVSQSLTRQFFLTPQIERIKEVQVKSNPIEKSTLIGDKAGRMKINHQIAPILPGHGDNSVFNLLRLMPGVLAAGEQSNDLLIWGAYESHSKIRFDGFTVFGLKNFNDNISVVNPFMVKNIEVMKGGYEARYGGRVGGIVDIAGKDGTLLKPTFTFNINTNTVNSMVQMPLTEKSSIMGAYRQTYYQLYNPTSLTLFGRRKDDSGSGKGYGGDGGSGGNQVYPIDFDILPDFVFRDANLKYSFKGNDGNRFAVSLYAGGDEFLYDMEGEIAKLLITRTEEEKNKQFGGSTQYSNSWSDGSITNFSLAYSTFTKQSFEQNTSENIQTGINRISREINADNVVAEITFTAEHTLNFREGHKLLLGVGAENNQVQLLRKTNREVDLDLDSNSPRLVAYVQDEFPVGELLELKTGVRMIHAVKLKKVYFEPRISASLQPVEGLKLNASWGLYNQFLSKTSVVDSSYNIAYFWINADDGNIPVLSAEHRVAGISYTKNGLTVSTEAYYKTTEGLNRYFNLTNWGENSFFEGDARSYGLDVFVKKEYKRHMAWISYTLSKTEEHFPFYINDTYKLAPHHQKHEFKFAGVLNYKSFYLSGNYIYGSGFARFDVETEKGTNLNQPYNRLDAALVYKFQPGKVRAEAGISVMNVLDADNIKFSNFSGATIDDISLLGIYADAVPFTPALFLKIEF
ncbi:TonB-dependent receptor plug domain-containing protein [Prolixibacteraceae bacterium Z1-6]|uniref:TonB-dependent receptor plug domain-containing protein n=1 Tax=Draconibacterium aestuarii TaxID=2998507 RepID=A0A9X3J5E7_9BACT|nr:TonB-dependent receptor plug domain-containing protein [Prolixibacteraceae bacterium Z1-6]